MHDRYYVVIFMFYCDSMTVCYKTLLYLTLSKCVRAIFVMGCQSHGIRPLIHARHARRKYFLVCTHMFDQVSRSYEDFRDILPVVRVTALDCTC